MSHPHRLPTERYTGRNRYFITICTLARRPLFQHVDTVDMVRSHFLRTSDEHRCEITAYCFMPDHLHLLLTAASPAGELQRFVALAKQRTGFVFARIAGERLWQASFFERTLRETDEDLVVVEYILNNPVRARLVNVPREYPHWGSQIFTREELLEAIALRARRP